jgi:hypothetical protein
MVRLLGVLILSLLGCDAVLAQVSTMGTTSMGLPTTPGTVVSSPLNGPSPFSAATLPGAADTSLAPVPLASDPTTPGTVINCAPTTAPSAATPAAALGTISTTNLGSATGTATPTTPVGSPLDSSSCVLNGNSSPSDPSSLPLTTPLISSVMPGRLEAPTAILGDTSIAPSATMPTPNATACNETVSMNLAAPGMMAAANATGATATPGVTTLSGC